MSKSPDLRSKTELSPDASEECSSNQCPHRHDTKGGKRCRRGEGQCIDHVGRARDPQTDHMHSNGEQQRNASPAMDPSPGLHRHSGQYPGDQQRLYLQKGQRGHTGKSRSHIDN